MFEVPSLNACHGIFATAAFDNLFFSSLYPLDKEDSALIWDGHALSNEVYLELYNVLNKTRGT